MGVVGGLYLFDVCAFGNQKHIFPFLHKNQD